MNTTTLIGTIGELKVAMKLAMIGHFPARPYIDNGIDILLENGKTIQVKTATSVSGRDAVYRFKINSKILIADYIILWCLDTEIAYVIPKEKLLAKETIGVGYKDSKYNQFAEKWDLLS